MRIPRHPIKPSPHQSTSSIVTLLLRACVAQRLPPCTARHGVRSHPYPSPSWASAPFRTCRRSHGEIDRCSSESMTSTLQLLGTRQRRGDPRRTARTRVGALCIRAALDFGRRRRDRGARRGIEIMRSHRTLVVFTAAVSIAVLVALAPPARAAETPRRGGVLLAAIAADAPSLDPHQEETFATLHLVAPCYSTLLQIDPYQYPKVIGDVATEWKIAADGLTYTFKLRQGIRFHDGSPLTAADVKATYEK